MAEPVLVIGGGLAGCEAALWLADRGLAVELWEQKPLRRSEAHTMDSLAELVCSNSLKADRLDSASGLLKAEMRLLGSRLLPAAEEARVAAGGALAVDRERFSQSVTALVRRHPGITVKERIAASLDMGAPCIVATGPLTDGALAEGIRALAGGATLSFYDAVAPVVTAESLDAGKIFAASRYGRGTDDYLNCPFSRAEYEAFYEALMGAERAELHRFDTPQDLVVYEGCMPIEVMAARGADTIRYGPLRPVGLKDPRTGHRPWANVQLRSENAARTLYNLVGFQTNLKWGEQKRVFRLIPGLANAEFVRYGVMHRNTFINAPQLLEKDLSVKGKKGLWFAGQITGVEGYMESAASGLVTALALFCREAGRPFTLPPATTMLGALMAHVTEPNAAYQPMGANMGILPPLAAPVRDKRARYRALARRSITDFAGWLAAMGLPVPALPTFEEAED